MAEIEKKSGIVEVTIDDKKLQDLIAKSLSDWYLSDDEVKNILKAYDSDKWDIKSISKNDREKVSKLVKSFKDNRKKVNIEYNKKFVLEYPKDRKDIIRERLKKWISKLTKQPKDSNNLFNVDFSWTDLILFGNEKSKDNILLDILVNIIENIEKKNSKYIDMWVIENDLSKKIVELLYEAEKHFDISDTMMIWTSLIIWSLTQMFTKNLPLAISLAAFRANDNVVSLNEEKAIIKDFDSYSRQMISKKK